MASSTAISFSFPPLTCIPVTPMSSSDSDSQSPVSDAAGGFGGVAFNFDGDGNMVPVHIGAPSGAPSPELLSLASTLMPFLQTRLQQNQARGNMETHQNMESGKDDGSGNLESGKDDGSMMVEGGGYGVGQASSSTTTAMAQDGENNDGKKKKGKKNKSKAKSKSKGGKKKY